METEQTELTQKKERTISRKTFILIVFHVFILTALGSYFLFSSNLMTGSAVNYNPDQFPLIDPDTAQLELDEFLEKQTQLSVSYTSLRKGINEILINSEGEYSFYFEDLTTGAWIGLNEKREFIPASLFKMPAVMAIVKKIEKGELSLDDQIVLLESDMANTGSLFGTLYLKGAGYKMTIKEGLIHVLEESDNTALNALMRKISYNELTEAYVATGLPWPKFTSEINDNLVSPKQYMNIFRSLYYSSYLRRTYSQLILSLLSESDFDGGIPAGIPKGVKVANKIGFFNMDPESYHDCGIVYVPKKPYMLCVMSSYTTQEDFNVVTSKISETVYDYVIQN